MSDLDDEELKATRKVNGVAIKNKIEKFKKFLKENNYWNELIVESNNLTIGGSLDLNGTQIKELPDNLTVGGSLDLSGTQIKELPDNLTVGGYLNLSRTQIKELPDNLTIGGSLYLSGTQIKELPDNLTVGGGLYLRGTQIKELPDNLMTKRVYKDEKYITLNNIKKGYNKERKYIYFDGILWGNIKSVKRRDNITIYKTLLGYCVVEKELSAHGKTLKEAIEDLTFKKLENIDTSEIIKEIKKTGKVTRLQYRAITGACRMGTEGFCNKHNIQDLEEIELEELRKILTLDNYGAKIFWDLIDNRGGDNE